MGDAEVEHLHVEGGVGPARRGHHDVLGLEVAVDDAHPVRRRHRVADGLEDGEHLLGRQRAAARDEGLQGLAAQELHDVPGDGAGHRDARVDHLGDVLAVDAGADASLVDEAPPHAVVVRQPVVEHLEGALHIEVPLGHLVDGAHAADGDHPLDAVLLREHLPRRQRPPRVDVVRVHDGGVSRSSAATQAQQQNSGVCRFGPERLGFVAPLLHPRLRMASAPSRGLPNHALSSQERT
ncbi:MAG: hypothetical protein U0324_32495 [Polyangiales bacterium]